MVDVGITSHGVSRSDYVSWKSWATEKIVVVGGVMVGSSEYPKRRCMKVNEEKMYEGKRGSEAIYVRPPANLYTESPDTPPTGDHPTPRCLTQV